MKFKNLLELQQHFNNELVCAEFMEQQRWNGAPFCPHCGSEHYYRTKTRFKHPDLKDYKDFLCKACCKKYSVLTGTLYESSKINLKAWVHSLYIIASHKKGISSLQLSRDLGVTQRTAWYILHRLRATLEETAPEVLQGTVMADETFVGGKNKNRHHDKKVAKSTGRAFIDKTPVLGLMEDSGKVRCFVIPDTKQESIQPILVDNIAAGSTLVTDEWSAYKGLDGYYNHVVVDHGRKQYSNNGFSTNALEGFWGTLKRGIIGIFHYVSRKHLHRYCTEFCYRFNHRHLTDIEKFLEASKKCADGRLLYKVLVT